VYICEQSMKKFIGIIILSFMFCNISVAEDDKKFLNDYLKDGYKIIREDVRESKSGRFYTLKKGNHLVLCKVWVGPEKGITFCYAP